MSNLIIPFALLVLFAVASSDASAKSWRGITPLHSTAQDVAKLSEACAETKTRCQFTFEGQEVMVVFSGSDVGFLACKQVPKRTVLAIIVRFSVPRKLRELRLKNKRYIVFDSSTPSNPNYKAYYYVQDGFIINTYKGKAIGMVYVAAQKDIHLCPEYYNDPKAFVDVGLVP